MDKPELIMTTTKELLIEAIRKDLLSIVPKSNEDLDNALPRVLAKAFRSLSGQLDLEYMDILKRCKQ